ncbi:hypothetical protein RND81_03G098500 [Saponaria officinalis]|uniref:Protein FAR1-RELATED SEQUENCE n=1 Tax=Saponaria officinalis TaxID=3572 RepID=A0AAW1M517_SAPOF
MKSWGKKSRDVYKEKGVRRNEVGDSEAQFHMMKRIRLGCSKGRNSKTNPDHVPCKVFVDGRIQFGDDKFVITQCDLVHNHELDLSMSRHVPNYRHIGEYFKIRIMLNDRAGIHMTRNFNTLIMEGDVYENLSFNYRDMRNAINQERRKGRFRGDAHELISYFDILKRENLEFYFVVQKDVNGALLNIFWADAQCRAIRRKTLHQYHMSFSPFVGVNHHRSTVIFAAALCMGRAPTVLLTDQCRAMKEAIRKNADKNLRSHPQFTAIDRDMRTLVHESTTEEKFHNLWAEMVEKYNLQQNSWVRDAWSIRRRWVPVYWTGTFCAGMSPTQHIEQSNRYFKTFVSIETGLKQFIDQFEFTLKRKEEEEKVLNFAYKNMPLKWDQGILFEDVFHKVYGCINKNMETLPNSLGFVKRRCFDVSFDTMSGEYKHIINCLDVLDVNVIPDKFILTHWRKDLVRGYENIRLGITIQVSRSA